MSTFIPGGHPDRIGRPGWRDMRIAPRWFWQMTKDGFEPRIQGINLTPDETKELRRIIQSGASDDAILDHFWPGSSP